MRAAAGNMEDPAVPAGRRSALGEFLEGPGYRVRRPDGRPDWLLVQSVSGCGVFRRGDVRVTAPTGTITVLPPGVEHDYGVAPEADSWGLTWAHVTPRVEWLALLDWPGTPLAGTRQVRLEGPEHEAVAAALSAAARSWRRAGPFAESFALNGLERALLLVAQARHVTTPSDPRVEAVLEFIDTHLDADLSVAVLAGVAGLSPSWFARVFADHVGASPQRHVESQRMVVAAQLLDVTDRPVVSVARAVGFADPLYFSTRFRRVVGLSPTAFRARHSGTGW